MLRLSSDGATWKVVQSRVSLIFMKVKCESGSDNKLEYQVAEPKMQAGRLGTYPNYRRLLMTSRLEKK